MAAVATALLAGCGTLIEVTPHAPLRVAPSEQTSVVVDRAGNTLAELHAEHDRDVVAFERLPGVLVDAVVAIEDHRFWTHRGVDARGVVRALGLNIREGEVVQGGSTITQQLAKLASVGSEQSVERKIVEASVALQLESQLSKEAILAQYLNTVYFGQGAYGAQTAARTYFDVDVDDLDLGQAATLAGMLRAPSRDNPIADPERARDRRDLVLGRMAELGVVSRADADAAAAAPLDVSAPQPQPWQAPYAVAHVLETIQHDDAFAALGADPVERAHQLYRGGLRIETTVDPHWQAAVEDAIATVLSEADDPHAGVVALDPTTGAVRALVGGRDYDDPDDPVARLNLATKARRQPGSAFKPVVLAAALTRGHALEEAWPSPASLTLPADPPDEPEPWSLANHDDVDFGELDLREATWYSSNTVYAQLAEAVGAPAIADLATRAGVQRPLPEVRSLSLGTVEVTPLEMARVNATLAAGGVRHDTRVVERITGPDGDVVWEAAASDGTRVMDPGVAWLTTDALRGVVTDGTGEVVDLDRPVAGKTGTTDDYADAWFTGYTPEMAMAVWVGFPEGRVSMVPPRTRRRVEGGGWPAEIFQLAAAEVLADVPLTDEAMPPGSLVTVDVDRSRGCRPNEYTPAEMVHQRTYLAGTQPTEVCAEPVAPPPASIPDVLGLDRDAAADALRDAGFTIDLVEECPDGGRDCVGARERSGSVWQQDPSERAVPGTAVRLSVYPVGESRPGPTPSLDGSGRNDDTG